MKAGRIAAIFFVSAVSVFPAWGTEAARTLAPASGVSATTLDKCPMHDISQEAMRRPGEPCPFDKTAGKMHEKCDAQAKKDCLEKAGEPCPWPRDAKHEGKMRDACDPKKRSEQSAK